MPQCSFGAVGARFFVAAFPQESMLYQSPTMNRTHITFVFAGDLWRVARSGGDAERLTTAVGPEASPYYSPDGKWIAFRAGYDGNLAFEFLFAHCPLP